MHHGHQTRDIPKTFSSRSPRVGLRIRISHTPHTTNKYHHIIIITQKQVSPVHKKRGKAPSHLVSSLKKAGTRILHHPCDQRMMIEKPETKPPHHIPVGPDGTSVGKRPKAELHSYQNKTAVDTEYITHTNITDHHHTSSHETHKRTNNPIGENALQDEKDPPATSREKRKRPN